MPERTSYQPGTPSWVELAAADVDAARNFYGEIFGWEFSSEPTGTEGADYTMVTRGGKPVAGMMAKQPEMPMSVWATYVTVDDLEGAVAKVGPAGGAVMMQPFDVMEYGRMAVVADPAGAVLCLWKPMAHIGAHLVNEHGALCWNELMTPDPAAIAPFYGEVLGWGTQSAPMEGVEYTMFAVGETGVAGCMKPPMEGIPPHWAVYFAIDDCDKAVEQAKALGATIMAEPMDIPGIGRMAAMIDPQGASVSIIQLEQPGT